MSTPADVWSPLMARGAVFGQYAWSGAAWLRLVTAYPELGTLSTRRLGETVCDHTRLPESLCRKIRRASWGAGPVADLRALKALKALRQYAAGGRRTGKVAL